MPELTTHSITLQGNRVTLRPMTEEDWPALLCWNNDPQVLYFSEGDDVTGYNIDEVQEIYRTVSQTALCFIIEYQGAPIGECWLQRMNIERIKKEYPDFDVRRIDLIIGEKPLWGLGLGTEVIGLLTNFAFQQEGVDYLFGVDISENNPRSKCAFEKNGFRQVSKNAQSPGAKSPFTLDLVAKNPLLEV